MSESTGAVIYLAGGCFWGTQHYFDCLAGVLSTQVGYANGSTKAPTYEQVKYEGTGHAETVMVRYDPTVITLEELLQQYYLAIDPVSVNRQGHDVGVQYRTGIYYVNEADAPVIRRSLEALQKQYAEKLAVEAAPLTAFYPAEEYHQKYLEKNPNGYCHLPAAAFEAARRFVPAKEQKGLAADAPAEPLTLIKATEADAAALHAMQLAAFAPLLAKYQDYDTNPGAEPVERTLERLRQPGTDYYCIRLHEETIGGVRVYCFGTVCSLKQLYILPSYQNRGLAQRAIRAVEALYPAVRRWQLDTILQESKLCYLYEKMGYRKTGQTKAIRPGMDLVYYAKDT